MVMQRRNETTHDVPGAPKSLQKASKGTMNTRMKTAGAAAAFAAIALSIPTAVSAYADEPTPAPATPTTTVSTPAPATPTTTVSTPVARIPDPQGPGCDAYNTALTARGGTPASVIL